MRIIIHLAQIIINILLSVFVLFLFGYVAYTVIAGQYIDLFFCFYFIICETLLLFAHYVSSYIETTYEEYRFCKENPALYEKYYSEEDDDF